MEKQPSKQKKARVHSSVIAAVLLAALFIIPSFVLAQPAGSPPTGNVDANFNSVRVEQDVNVTDGDINVNGAGKGLLIADPLGEIYNAGGLNQMGSIFRGDGTHVQVLNGLNINYKLDIDGAGDLTNIDSTVKVKDDDGFEVADDAGVVGLNIAADGSLANNGANNGGKVVVKDNFSIFNGVSELFSFSPIGLIIQNTGIILNAPGAGGMSINNAGAGGLTVNATTGGVLVNATSGGLIVNAMTGGVGIISQTGGIAIVNNGGTNVALSANGRAKLTNTTDASGVVGSGVLEIADSLRLDGNEIITNAGDTLYLQHDNSGDLRIDDTTLMVDASVNRVGVGTISPAATLDVNGQIRASSVGRFYHSGWGGSVNIPGNSTGVTSQSCAAQDIAVSCLHWSSAGTLFPYQKYTGWTNSPSCTVYWKNTSSTATSGQAAAVCFSSDG